MGNDLIPFPQEWSQPADDDSHASAARPPQTAKTALAEGAVDALAGVAPVGDPAATVPDSVKTMLPPGAFMTSDHRYYFNGEGPLPSVTTILEVMSKPALTQWKAREAVRAYIRNRSEVDKILMDQFGGEDKAINRAIELVDAQRDKAASIGTSVHLLADIVSRGAETATEGFRASDEEIPYLNAWRGFLGFLERSGGRIVSSEHAVWSLNGYAGTYDLIVQMPTKSDANGNRNVDLWLIDIKTSKSYYPEYALQLAAYRWADSIILPGDPTPYPMPEIHRTAVLHLRPDQYQEGWRLIEYPTTYADDFLTFLGCLEVWKWRKSNRFSKQVLNTVTA